MYTKTSTEKQADPKYPPDTDPEDFDPDEEESWPDQKEEQCKG